MCTGFVGLFQGRVRGQRGDRPERAARGCHESRSRRGLGITSLGAQHAPREGGIILLLQSHTQARESLTPTFAHSAALAHGPGRGMGDLQTEMESEEVWSG